MRKSVVIAIGAAAIFVAVASGVAATAAPRIAEGGGPVPSTSAGPRISVADAKQIALAAVPGGTVIQVESDDVHDRPVWKVVVATPNGRAAVSIDAATGQVLDNQPAESGDDAASPGARTSDDDPGHDVGDDHGGDRGRGHGTEDRPLHH
jgi:hypothetical protein